MAIPDELTKAFGVDRMMERVLEGMKAEFEAALKQKGEDYYKRIGGDLVKRLKPRLQQIVTMFEDLGLLMNQTLREQALIAAVSAFEVYLRELTVSVVLLNPNVRKKFHPEIGKALNVTILEEYGQNAKRAQAEIVADLVKLDINRIESLLKRLINLETVFSDKRTELKVSRIFEVRHVIIHRAGVTDPKFRKVTKSKEAVDRQIKLNRRFVFNSIKALRTIAEKIETQIH